MKILIDNGHGIDTKGKCSPDAIHGLTNSPLYFREYQWAREVACMVGSLLAAEGYDAELLVKEQNDISLQERVRRANKYRANEAILVSIHVNAAGNGQQWMNARGWAIYTSVGITNADKLADCIALEAKRQFTAPGLKLRLKADKYMERDQEENFYILRNTNCPAVLVENFFQDNKEDVKYIKSDIGKATCADVVVEGIKAYLKTL